MQIARAGVIGGRELGMISASGIVRVRDAFRQEQQSLTEPWRAAAIIIDLPFSSHALSRVQFRRSDIGHGGGKLCRAAHLLASD